MASSVELEPVPAIKTTAFLSFVPALSAARVSFTTIVLFEIILERAVCASAAFKKSFVFFEPFHIKKTRFVRPFLRLVRYYFIFSILRLDKDTAERFH